MKLFDEKPNWLVKLLFFVYTVGSIRVLRGGVNQNTIKIIPQSVFSVNSIHNLQ
jgi:hypothetical protein